MRLMRARLESGRLLDLLTARDHAPYLARHRLHAVMTRIRMIAVAFSGLTLLWIALDATTLTPSQWAVLAVFRVVAAAAFMAFAMVPAKERSHGTVLGLLAATLAVPMVLFCVAQFVIGDTRSLEGGAAINARLYEALPFIVLAGLSIFPLVAAEGVLFAVPVLATVALVQFVSVGFDGVRLLSTLWVSTLVLGVYLLACAIQLHYMMALLRRASHDPLTGALSRRSGVEIIDLHFRLACEQEAPFTVVFLDIDNFKGINDGFGHDAGDKALRDVSAALTHHLRQADAVIRWGGEEFVLVLTNTGIEGVRVAMKRIIGEWLGTRPDGGPITASIGTAERIADGAADWAELVRLADERMYAAKTAGKARCILPDGTALVPA